MTMRTVILIRAALPLLLALPQPALAWGKSGHAAIANVAELNLRPAVWSELQTLLATEGVTHLSKVASWADTQRAAGDPVHTTRIPIDGSAAPAHACTGTAMCADEAIAVYSAILSDRSRSAADREIALKYIVHLVGDLHQPLHGSDPIGYNLVTLNGAAPVMIHAIWDDTIIDDHGVASALLAQELINNGVPTAGGGVPRDWAVESSQIARDQVYDDLPACWSYKAPSCPTAPVPLSTDYTTRKYPIVAQRLKQAGYRLATLLNTLLGT
jgi:hypothetical protein